MKLFGMDVKWLSEEHKLLYPDLECNNAGILPAILVCMGIVDEGELEGKTVNSRVLKRLREKFPEGIDNVVFFIVDGLGAAKLEELGGLIWENIKPEGGEGLVVQATFPTMTTTNMTSILHGQLPGSHGFVGYNIYNEAIGCVFNGINGRYLKEGEERSITGMEKHKFVEGLPLSQILADKVNVKLFLPAQQEREGLLDLILSDVPLVPYEAPDRLLGKIIGAMSAGDKGQFLAVYLGMIDYVGHNLGPDSDEYQEAIKQLEGLLKIVIDHPKVKKGRTLVLLTSDHGQSQVDHGVSRWLTGDEVKRYDDRGVVLSTSGRVLHAYAKRGTDRVEARRVLEELARGEAIVIDQKTALEMAGDSEERWGHRIGDYLLICPGNTLIDVPEVVPLHGFSPRLFGQHGSTTVEEIFVPVAIWGGKSRSNNYS